MRVASGVPPLLLLVLVLLLTQEPAHAKRRKRGQRAGEPDSSGAPQPCDSGLRLRASDGCEQPGTAEELAATVKRPASCGTLVLFTSGGASMCSDLPRAAASRCADLHAGFAAARAQVKRTSSVRFLVIDEREEPQLTQWGREYGARPDNDPPAAWWVPRTHVSTAASTATSVELAAERAFLRGYELADAYSRSSAGLSTFFKSYCGLELPLPQNQKPLLAAISNGDPAEVQRLVHGGVPVHPRGPTGTEECLEDSWEQICYHPLLAAFREAQGPSDLDLIRPLLAAGADIQVRGSDGSTVMHDMMHRWAETFVPEEVPADANPKNRFLKWLIENSPIDNGAVDKYGQTIYHLAAGKHNYHMLEWMVTAPSMKGVDIDAKDVASNTALHFAAGGDTWFPAMSKSLMFTPEHAERHYINFNAPSKYAGWDNGCLENFRKTASTSNGNATNFLAITEALNAPNCQFFYMPVKLLLDHGSKAVNVQNLAGETPLHRACYTNDVKTLKLLLDAGADPSIRSIEGHTPATLATTLGCTELLQHLPPLTAADNEMLAGHETPRMLAGDLIGQQVCGAEEASTAEGHTENAAQTDNANRDATTVDDGGWWDHEKKTGQQQADDAGSQLSVLDCDIAVRHASNFTAEEFERDFVALRRPVAVIGGALSASAKAHSIWKRESFADRYGHVQVGVAEIPYASSFGRGDKKQDEQSTVEQYVKYMESMSASDEFPKYIFERGASALRFLPDVGLWDLDFFNTSHLIQHSFQFYLGPPRTGAPNHFHSHALNVLLYGEKRWFLTPPRYAEYSKLAPMEFLKEAVPDRRHHMLQCMQRSGDVLYVPKNWGHAILNTRTSIGFAGEFRIIKTLPSPADIQGGYSWVGKDAQRSLMLMSEGFSARTKLHKNYLSLE